MSSNFWFKNYRSGLICCVYLLLIEHYLAFNHSKLAFPLNRSKGFLHLLTLSRSESNGEEEEERRGLWSRSGTQPGTINPHSSGLTVSEMSPNSQAFWFWVKFTQGIQKRVGVALKRRDKSCFDLEIYTRGARELPGIRGALISVSSGAAGLAGLLSLRQWQGIDL